MDSYLSEQLRDYVEMNTRLTSVLQEYLNSSSSSNDDELGIPRPMFDRTYTGHRYVIDVLAGHPERSYQCFRLPAQAFAQLRDMLVAKELLSDTRNITAAEQLAIFLRVVAHAHSFRQVCEFFQHSLETVSRYFNRVLRAMVSLSGELIRMPSPESNCSEHIRRNKLFFPYFRNALGAIDGTHILAIVSIDSQNRYRNRKGFTSQNVMAAVSFERQFLYVAAGWEGSAADMRVLRWTLEEGHFRVPVGKYYLVDSGYAKTDKFIAPFRGYRYHLSDYRGHPSRRYSVAQELYNHRHAQLRNVVERTFGIWKEIFQVLGHMRQFDVTTQGNIVIACAILHNFIGRYHSSDVYFNMSQTDWTHDREFGEVSSTEREPVLHTSVGERATGDLDSPKHVSAIKGSRALHGKPLDSNLHVTWEADVYDPPVTSSSHTVKGHRHRLLRAKILDHHKHKHTKARPSNACSSDRKHSHRRSSSSSSSILDTRMVRMQALARRSLQSGFEHSKIQTLNIAAASDQESAKCAGRFHVESPWSLPHPIAEAS